MDEVEPTKIPDIDPGWQETLGSEFKQDYMFELKKFLTKEMKKHQVFPPGKDIFNALKFTPFKDVKVVILGQDPYHGPGQAHGLCFSVPQGIDPPPSLQNIFKELKQSLDLDIPTHGNLQSWAHQGVLLLNTCLTVRAKSPQSHSGQGWEQFTDKVIQTINDQLEGIVFMLWGSPARKKAQMIDKGRHFVLEAPHPSPLSAHRGFFGCNHFKLCNQILRAQDKKQIDWTL